MPAYWHDENEMLLCNIELASVERYINKAYTTPPFAAKQFRYVDATAPPQFSKRSTRRNAMPSAMDREKNASRCRHHTQRTSKKKLAHNSIAVLSDRPSASLHLLHPPSRHDSPPTLTLHLTPPITLIRRNQHHLLALLHARLSLASRIVSVQRFDVSECRFLRAAAPGSDSRTLFAYGRGGGVDATRERGGGH